MTYQNVLYHPLSRASDWSSPTRPRAPRDTSGLGYRSVRRPPTINLPLKRRLPKANSFPARTLLVFSLPSFASAVVTLLQGWGDIALLQTILGQFGTTGAYYLVVTSVSFLSILWTPTAGALYPALSSSYTRQGPTGVSEKLGVAMRLV